MAEQENSQGKMFNFVRSINFSESYVLKAVEAICYQFLKKDFINAIII
jgi:hypothetical protein